MRIFLFFCLFFGISLSGYTQPFPKEVNLMDVRQRWAYGMKNMDYNIAPSQMPHPGATYMNGIMYMKFRKADTGGSW